MRQWCNFFPCVYSVRHKYIGCLTVLMMRAAALIAMVIAATAGARCRCWSRCWCRYLIAAALWVCTTWITASRISAAARLAWWLCRFYSEFAHCAGLIVIFGQYVRPLSNSSRAILLTAMATLENRFRFSCSLGFGQWKRIGVGTLRTKC